MKKFNKKDYINILIIALFIFIYVLLITNFYEYLYGSTVDWDCQHWAIPDYLRKLFYSTGNILPNFAFNLGNGQNIFNLSYYGLLNPIILLSYLFPFIEMIDYIQIASILGLFISAVLLYKWLLNRYNSKIALLSSIVFVSTVPILFHSHRHIMFTNYMPFLILALIGVDKYFDENKKSLLILSIFLIVLTSYFFSVSAIFAIVIYGISRFFAKNKKVNIKLFFKEGFRFLFPLLLGVLMSMIIILPTFYVIFEGRTESNVSINFLSLLIPSISIENLFYSAYSPGINALMFVSLIFAIVTNNRENRVLSILLTLSMIFPIFCYILNGTMYIDQKVFITYVPLLILLVADLFYSFDIYRVNIRTTIIVSMIVGIMIFLINLKNDASYLFLADLLMIITLLLNKKNIKNYKVIPILIVIITSLVSVGVSFYTDNLYARSSFLKLEESDSDIFDEIFENEDNIYRVTNYNYLLQNINRIPSMNYYVGNIYSSTSNNNYKEFYYNDSGNEITQRSYGKITSSMNIFYNIYNANKYLIPNKFIPVGYEKVNGSDNLYINNDVFPIIYATSNILSKSEYEKLSFPYNMEAIFSNVVIDGKSNNEISSSIRLFDGNVKLLNSDSSIYIENDNGHYKIKVSNEAKVNLKVDGLDQKDILIIKFDLANNQNCSKGDLSITINGMKNVLTCKNWKYHNKNTEFNYVLSSNDIITDLKVIFSKGSFDISNVELYKISYDDLKSVRDNIDEFNFDKKKTKDNRIVGDISVSNDGYIVMSIPYDRGFSIYLNGEKTSYDKVDNGFIGIKVKKGTYNVEIEYNSPLLKEGIVISCLSFIVYFLIIALERGKIKKSIAKK